MDEPYLKEAAVAAFYELLDTEGRALFGALLGALLVSAARDRFIIVSRRRLTARKQVLLVFLTLGSVTCSSRCCTPWRPCFPAAWRRSLRPWWLFRLP